MAQVTQMTEEMCNAFKKGDKKESGSENPFMIKVENDGITKEQSAKLTDVGNVEHPIRRDITTAQTEQSTVETAKKKGTTRKSANSQKNSTFGST